MSGIMNDCCCKVWGGGGREILEEKKTTKMCVLWSVLSWKKGCVC